MKTQNVMKSLILIVVITIICLLQAYAQAQHREEPPHLPDSAQIVKMVDHLSMQLSLTDYQKAEIIGLSYKHFQSVGELMEKQKIDHDKNKDEMDKFRLQFESDVKAKLSDQQKEKFEGYVKSRRYDNERHKQL